MFRLIECVYASGEFMISAAVTFVIAARLHRIQTARRRGVTPMRSSAGASAGAAVYRRSSLR